MTEREAKIINLANTLPLGTLVSLIEKGETSLTNLVAGGMNADKGLALARELAARQSDTKAREAAMKAEMEAKEAAARAAREAEEAQRAAELAAKKAEAEQQDNEAWAGAFAVNTPRAYREYMEQYPSGLHRDEARQTLAFLENNMWSNAQINLNEVELKNYLDEFPDGTYAAQCRDMLNDIPWLEALRRNTISDYESYMMLNPGKHDMEALAHISDLKDDQAWDYACSISDDNRFEMYLSQYPDGRHAGEANQRILAAAGREQYLRDLSLDPNAFSADDIQRAVQNNVVTRDDIAYIMGEERTDAIMQFVMPSELPTKTPPAQLQGDTTEVYFWGTPGSGKTCALGSVISSVRSQGIYEAITGCSGYDYMVRLSNIFGTHGFCTFPDSTAVGNIQEMVMELRDSKDKPHRITLVDLAGELFRGAYFKQNGLFLEEENEAALNTTLNYLNDNRNNKIHFFVVEYGAHLREWEGLRMGDYLDNMMGYLKNQNVFRKKTVGVYVLVTKCDKIDCHPEDRPRMAAEYVQQELPSFWNALCNNCKGSGVSEPVILSFSVGNTFAQNLCEFDPRDTNKVIDKLLTKTHARGSFWDKFRK